MSTIGKVVTEFDADTSGYDKGIGHVKESSGGLMSHLKTIGDTAAGMFTGMMATSAVGWFKDAAGAAAEDEAATSRLETTLQNLAREHGLGADAVDSWTTQLDGAIAKGAKLAFTDDDIRDSFGFLATATGDTDEAFRRQAIAMDLARGANIPLSLATKMLGKMTDENIQTFKKMGITFKEGTTEADALAQVQAKFANQAKAFADGTGGQFEQAKIRMSELKETIGYALIPIFNVLVGWLLKLIDVGEKYVTPMLRKLKDVAGEVKARFFELIDAIDWEKWGGKLSRVFGGIVDLLSKVDWGAIGGAISTGIGVAFDLLSTAAGIVWDVIVKVVDYLAGVDWASIGGAIMDGIGVAFDMVSQAVTKISDFLTSVDWQGFIDKGTEAGSSVGAAFSAVDWAGIGGALMDFLGPAMIDAWHSIVEAVKPLGAALKELAGPTMDLLESLKPLAEIVGVVLVVAFRLILEAVQILAPVLGVVLIGAIKAVGLIFEGLAKVIDGVVLVLKGIIDFVVGVFTGDWDRAWKGIKEIFEGVWNVLSALVETVLKLIWASIDTGLNAIKTLWEGIWNKIGDFVTGIWDKIKGFVSDGIEKVKNLGPDMLAAGTSLMDKLWDGIKDIALSVYNWFADLPGVLLGKLGDMGRLLFDAGKKLIQGFLDGIVSMFGAVQEKLGDLKDKLTGWKGPPEVDAVILFPAGQMVIQGFINGLASMEGGVKSTLNNYVAMVASAGETLAANGAALVGDTGAALTGLRVVQTGVGGTPQNGYYDAKNNLTWVGDHWVQGVIQKQDLGMYSGSVGPGTDKGYAGGGGGLAPFGATNASTTGGRTPVNFSANLTFNGPTNSDEVTAGLNKWWDGKVAEEFGHNAVLSGVKVAA